MDNPEILQIPQCACGHQLLPGRYGRPICWKCEHIYIACPRCDKPVAAEKIGGEIWRFTCEHCWIEADFPRSDAMPDGTF